MSKLRKNVLNEYAATNTSYEAAAVEVYQILRSFDYTVQMFDDDGNEVHEPEMARRFFAMPRGLLVSITDSGENSSIRLHFGRNVKPLEVMGLARTLRMSAWKFNLLFSFRKFDADRITPKDFATSYSVREGWVRPLNSLNYNEDYEMNVLEGMYGTTKSSYLKLPNARMIIRHSAPVNEQAVGARGRNIDRIYVENADGERMLFPVPHPLPARAMAQHINQGGSFGDTVAQAIVEMAQDFASLIRCARHSAAAAKLDENIMQIREACREKISEMRRTFARMCREKGYMNEAERLSHQGDPLVENEETAQVVAEKAKRLRKFFGSDCDLSEDVIQRVARNINCPCLSEGRKPLGADIPMIRVLDVRVAKDVWNAFVGERGKKGSGKLPVDPNKIGTTDPDFDIPAKFNERDHRHLDLKLARKLQTDVIPMISDDSFANLLNYIATELPGESKPEKLKPMRAIASHAIELASKLTEGRLATRAPAIKEFINWLDQFEPTRAIMEQDDLLDADDVAPNTGNMDLDGDVIADLEADGVEMVADDLDGFDGSGDLDDFEEEYDFELNDLDDLDDLDPDLDSDDLGLDDSPEMFGEDVQLTDEDVLLPPFSKGDIRSEVTKSTVFDPDTGEEKEPDENYISRLRQLSTSRNTP